MVKFAIFLCTLLICARRVYCKNQSIIPSYNVTYCYITALGEPVRFLLSYGGIDFEDDRIPHEVWPQLKPQTSLGQLPTLEIDEKTLYQSDAIVRFLAEKFNLNGSNDFEALEIDVNLETIADLRALLARWLIRQLRVQLYDVTETAAVEEETLKKAAFYLDKFETAIEKNGGYIVGGKLSAADIVLTALSGFLSHMAGKNLFADYPKIQSVIDKVLAEPKIKSYIEKHPKTDC